MARPSSTRAGRHHRLPDDHDLLVRLERHRRAEHHRDRNPCRLRRPITDGYRSSSKANLRYPDDLACRLVAAAGGAKLGVVSLAMLRT
jgi:hypothetical protein